MTHPAAIHGFTRREAILASTILGLGMSLTRIPIRAMAHQDANDPLSGITVEQLSAGTSALVPDHVLVLLRIATEPGTVIPPHSHPGPVALYVDSGLFGTEFFEGSGTIVHAPVDGTLVSAGESHHSTRPRRVESDAERCAWEVRLPSAPVFGTGPGLAQW